MATAGSSFAHPTENHAECTERVTEVYSSPYLKRIKVLLVDDHTIFRAGLRMLIESRSTFDIVGETDDFSDAVSIAGREQPDIILLDLVMGPESGLDYVPKLLMRSPNSRVLVLTGVDDPKVHERAVHLGAVGLVLKNKAPEVLIKAIEKVHTGEAWLDRVTIANVLAELSNPTRHAETSEGEKIKSLTKREREVISLVAQGLKNKQIAARLFISEVTVRHHLTSTFGKLDVVDRFELILFALKHGLAGTSV